MAKGDRYKCDECGMIVLIEQACGCSSCGLVCCGVPMKKLGKKAASSKSKK